jgi:hypothetical protein
MKPIKIILLMAAVLSGWNSVFGQTWNLTYTGFLTKQVTHVVSSADGYMLAATVSGGIYTSTNSGKTWTPDNVQNLAWGGIASSADGNRLAAAVYGGGIFVSTNAGALWTPTKAPTNYWICIASSADGSFLVAGVGTNGSIYISPDAGASWTQTTAPTNNFWGSIASSADGNKLVAASGFPYYDGIENPNSTNAIYTSTDSGATWTQTKAPTNTWSSVASSADGSKLVAAVGYPSKGVIYTSIDSGANWLSNSAPYAPDGWQSVASSADGVTLVAVEGDSMLVSVSTNSGATWSSNTIPNTFLLSVASSADGNKLMAGSAGIGGRFGGVFISQIKASPQLNLTPTDTNLTLAWTVPSTNFVVQQSSDLISWIDLTNTPTLNLTNLNNELVLSPTNSTGFFRLSTP